jgi:hypothetical protein
MEPEQTKQEQEVAVEAKQSVWNTATPLSKYLAMALFIILPFVGGYIGYVFTPEKIIEVDKEVIREVEKVVEIPVTSNEVVLNGNLLDDFDISRTVNDEYEIEWSVKDDVLDAFAGLETVYITFSLVPVGEEIGYKNSNGVSQNIGDGFALKNSVYTFNPKYYEENFSWPLNWGAAYQIVGRLLYQPSEFGCNPLYPNDCEPVYDAEDGQLVQRAEKYIFVSEPFVLE